MMDINKYLERIGFEGDFPSADADGLRRLHRRHLLNVPFENLDIHWKRPITIDTDEFYRKIVESKRGGFCYELNGLFNELLVSLGFETTLISARVFGTSGYGPEYDHAAIIVTIGDGEYLADVGFGDFTAEPLRFVSDEEQHDANGTFVIRKYDSEYLEVAKVENDGWKSQYIFKDIPRDLSEFAEMCNFQQYSPESHFTMGKICSIMTENGRKSISDSKYTVTANGEKTETPLHSEKEFEATLEREFGIRRDAA